MKDIKSKKDFFNYLLHNYEFNDRTAVWVINFIKSHPDIIENVSFTDSGTHDKTLRITCSNIVKPTLILEKAHMILVDGETIFHELNLNKSDKIFIQLYLDQLDVRYQSIMQDELETRDEKTKEELYLLIDQSLDNGDKEQFIVLSQELKMLEEKSR